MQGDVCSLRQERLRKPWTKQQLADFAQVSLSTVERAERGDPIRIDSIQRLCACLKKSPEQLGLLKIENETSQIRTAEDSRDVDATASTNGFNAIVPLYGNEFQAYNFIATNITARLWNLAFKDRCPSSEMTYAIQQAIKEFDVMNIDNKNYPVTRREALCQLATLPLITMQLQLPGSTVHSRRYDDAITHCTAALEACWQLYRESDPIGIQHAFDCVSTYVPLLETIAHDSSRLRKQALDLAARYAILKNMLGWGRVKNSEAVDFALNALFLCNETDNIELQLSARTKLNWTYLRDRQYIKSWETMQGGVHALTRYQRRKNGPTISSGMVGNFYSGYSMAQIRNGIDPDTALGIATDSEPIKGHIAFVEFTAPEQAWEAAWTYCAKGDSRQAIAWLERLMDLKTLNVHPGITPSESEGVANILTQTLLQSQERDIGHIIHVWKAGMGEAQNLKHERLYEEAIANFAIMQALWPGERRIMKLAPLTSHW